MTMPGFNPIPEPPKLSAGQRLTQKVRAYSCPSCRQLYFEKDEAYDCCEFGQDAWTCSNIKCEAGLHKTEAEAEACGKPDDCECGHRKRHHAVTQGWQGCYDIDCRCPGYAVGVLV